MPVPLKQKPGRPQAPELETAFKVVEYAHDTTKSLLDGFTALRTGPGAPSDEQQDLLRAMVLFAGAGLDSCMKHMIVAAVPRLAAHNDDVRKELQKFTKRRLQRGADDGDASFDAGFLAQILVGDAQANLLAAFTDDLTGKSLQSVEQMNRVAAALGVSTNSRVKKAVAALKDAFGMRNKIAHEMDINFSAANRNRNSRRRDDMVRRTNELLEAVDAVLAAVDGVLAKCP